MVSWNDVSLLAYQQHKASGQHEWLELQVAMVDGEPLIAVEAN